MRPVTLLLLLVLTADVLQAEPVRLIDLRGQWRFQTGAVDGGHEPGLDDSGWAPIFVPAAWEDEGYPGYDGEAWYRMRFTAPEGYGRMALWLDLGRIDDCDQVWVNGVLIGATGGFPPNYFSAYNRFRRYSVPAGLIQTGENIIAIRVFDEKLQGGLLEGRAGLYGEPRDDMSSLDLSGTWKLRTGDVPDWREPDLDDTAWKDILVPMLWDAQGMSRFDGKAWYRKTFDWHGDVNRPLYLHLGRVDDFDEVFLNGTRIGQTGRIPDDPEDAVFNNEYRKMRLYPIPEGLLMQGRNVLAVRVFDGGHDGGIYEGPVMISHEGSEQPGEPGFPAPADNRPWFVALIMWLIDLVKSLFS